MKTAATIPGPYATRLEGVLERITYVNEETGYTVAKVKVRGRKDLVTVVGSMVCPVPGERIRMEGAWGAHPQYGEQFQIQFCETAAPATVEGMERYLGSGLVKGIGPVTARRIVERFREETLDVIETSSERLSEVQGIGPGRIAMIRRAWDEQKEIRQVMLFLQSHGVSSAYAAKIFKQYGNDAVRVVRENPYRLAADIYGIGFLTADRIAGKLGFAKDSPLRAEAGILHVLHELAGEGHVYYPRGALVEACAQILESGEEVVAAALERLAASGALVLDDSSAVLDGAGDAAEGEARAVYLGGYYTAETQLASRLRSLLAAPGALRTIAADKAIAWVQENLSIRLAERQVEAVRCAAGSKVMVLTGGPGTGKTTIIRAILRIFSALRARILLAAPTGRAAKRMGEATGREARTIHRLLEYSPRKGGFQKNDASPLECDLLVVDEASMIDTLLMHHLLKAVPLAARLLLVGDGNQLPSVGAGNVLRDIIASGAVPVVALHEVFRQARRSAIVVNAHRINAGQMPRGGPSGETLADFYVVAQEDPQACLRLILQLVTERIPARFGLDPLRDIQVLTPMHRGVVGATNLNLELQKALNPGDGGVFRGGRCFRAGDKVMQIANDYDKEVFNGDIGQIAAIHEERQEVDVVLDDRKVVYDFADLDALVHAYAVSIHKSQGSEYPAVVVPLLPQHYVMLQRNLLYTAVTRARKLAVLVGSPRAIAMAVKNNRTEKRFTLLRQRLAGALTGELKR